ncbi:MAG TPA: DUF4127 family protein [Trueperaceae bacterium]|nr:DUF4127 family protein [Trueperaceae bacterium]
MRVALVPLDDRPYNLSYVTKLGRIAGVEIITPPLALVGWYFTPGDTKALADWLLELPGDIDAVIVAVDMLACGGLLASRTEGIGEAEAVDRLTALERLRALRPELPVLAFDTIIRTSLSARDPESRRVHRLLHRWTTLAGKVRVTEDAKTKEEFSQVSAAIPPHVIERYRRVRERKHAVNRHALELTRAGVIDVLHLLMEDVGPEGHLYGVHKEEQAELRALGGTLGVADRVFLHNGTDEGACTLLAGLVTSWHELRPRIYVRYSTLDGACQVPTFEDRPFGENLASFVAAAGGVLTNDYAEADAVLAVHTPYGDTPDVVAFSDLIAGDLESGMSVALVDTTTNTADLALMAALAHRVSLDDLTAYSAWNTACNALGTALAQLVLALAGGDDAREANRLLVIERLLDDYVYEGIVRPRVNQRLEDAGSNPWDLGDGADATRSAVAHEMEEEVARTLSPHVRTAFEYSVTLPWPRTFEPAIEVWHAGRETSA